MSGIQTTVDTITLHGGQVASINLGEVGATVRNNGLVTVSYSDSETVRSSPEGTIFAAASVALSGVQFFYASSRAELVISPLFTDLDTVTEIAARIALLEGAAPTANGATLNANGLGGELNRIDAWIRNYATAGGINDRAAGAAFLGAEGDEPNGNGSSFFLGNTLAVSHETSGSVHVFNSALVITDDTPDYGEGGAYEGYVRIERIGAYGAGAEIALVPTVPSRAAGVQVVVTVADTLAQWATALDDPGEPPSQWAQTGTRSFSSIANGLVVPGTALAVMGDHEHGMLAYFPTLTKKLIASVGDPAKDNYIFSLNALGDLEWRNPAVDTAEPLTKVKRMAADTPGTPGNWRVDGAVSVGGGIALAQGALIDVTTATIGTNVAFRAIGGLQSSTVLTFVAAVAAGTVPNNSLFLDSADNVLKQKNNAGTVSAL